MFNCLYFKIFQPPFLHLKVQKLVGETDVVECGRKSFLLQSVPSFTLGGVFRITDGLARDFGEDRCFDTPLAESGIVGFALGMAMNGFKPVVEMQFDAFAYPAFEQLVSHVAKMRNRTRGAINVPMVIRVPYAGGIGGGEHHSDSADACRMVQRALIAESLLTPMSHPVRSLLCPKRPQPLMSLSSITSNRFLCGTA